LKELNEMAVVHFINEVVDNSVDEWKQGFGKTVIVKINNEIDPRGPRITIIDEGRGIPQSKLFDCVATESTSGKYGDIAGKGSGGYGATSGLNGLGNKITNANSRDFQVTSIRDGKRLTLNFDQGDLIHEGKRIPSDKASRKLLESIVPTLMEKAVIDTTSKVGTTIEFTPDATTLGRVSLKGMKNDILSYLETSSYVNAGIEYVFIWDKDKPITICHPNGTLDLFHKEVSRRKIHPLCEPVHITWKGTGIGYNIVYCFAKAGTADTISYVNGKQTIEGGEHVKAIFESMGLVTAELNKRDFIPKSQQNKYKITGNEVRDMLFAIIIADKEQPKYGGGNVKSLFISEDYKPIVLPLIKNEVSKWINKDKIGIDKIGKHAAELAKFRYETSKNKENIIKAGSNKYDLFKSIDSKKFQDCNEFNPEKNELFICEGDSAAGNLKVVCDKNHQAVFALRGKCKNVVEKDGLSEELVNLAKVLGCGLGAEKNIKKLRYKRIVILTDADDDGFHIAALVLGFFFRYYPELIQNGNIFVAKPPLFTLAREKGNPIFIPSMEHLWTILSGISTAVFDIIDPNGKKLPKHIAEIYMRKVVEYSNWIENYGKDLGVHPLILEAVALCYNDLNKNNTKTIENFGFHISKLKKNEKTGEISISINKGYEHFYLSIDRNMITNILKPICDRILNEIGLKRLRFLGRATGKTYGKTYYEQGQLVWNTLFGKNSKISVRRNKGLGSNSAEELSITSTDPTTRCIIQITMDDYDNSKRWIHWLMTNSDEKKRLFSDNIIS
jgi:DNA gyrase subunit B